MSAPIASLSLDLDNKWSYLKTHGEKGWESLPSYLDLVVPRVLELLTDFQLTITFFVVGQDAVRRENASALASLSAAGHEIGNHSFHHEPWLHRYDRDQVRQEVALAHEQIEQATGQAATGFRGPGYSCTPETIDALIELGYAYDASALPTFVGPLARAFYMRTARLTGQQREERGALFGRFRDGWQTLKPHVVTGRGGSLVEVPITTMPGLRTPMHMSYLHYLASRSRRAALFYFDVALRMCRIRGVAPSLLLHPLDVLGPEDGIGLDFFPAMGVPRESKLALVRNVLDRLVARFRVTTLREHAAVAEPR